MKVNDTSNPVSGGCTHYVFRENYGIGHDAPVGTKGVKADKGKRQWWFLGNIIEPIQEVIDILEYGNTKYPADDGANWRLVPEAKKRYTSALYRHLTQWQLGERNDEETGKSHLAHAITNLCFLLWFEIQENKKGN